VWVQVLEKESKGPPSVMQDLPFLEVESPATTGIEAPVIAQHLSAHTCMSVITVGAEEPTNNQTIQSQSQSLNQGLSRGQKFRRHFVWDPAAVVRSWTVLWTESLLSHYHLLLLLNLTMWRLWTPSRLIPICLLSLPLLMLTASNPFSPVIQTSPLSSLCI
jgi:hypothetical protein